LREIPEDAIGRLLLKKDALAACDIAVFVHDRCQESCYFLYFYLSLAEMVCDILKKTFLISLAFGTGVDGT